VNRNEPMRRICPNCAQLMALVRRTRDLRDTCAIFDFKCESCGVVYTEADDSERTAHGVRPASPKSTA
jgi:hypothetical protein